MIPDFVWKHIREIVSIYKGDEPLSNFLKSYFKKHPNAGSRDRKLISAFIYSWYRCSKAIKLNCNTDNDFETKLKLCLKTTESKISILKFIDIEERFDAKVDFKDLFDAKLEFSDNLDKEKWLKSILVQPDLFLRIRKDRDKVINLLTNKSIPFKFITDNCISILNGEKIDEVLPLDTYVVQDASSQFASNFFKPQKNENWYDCCAGAGGKSLALKDFEPQINLTVSDKRQSIIQNLLKRFNLYGHKKPTKFVLDITDKLSLKNAIGNKLFDHIICDVPCSGSGTWARTPEQLYFFNEDSFVKYPLLQQKIATNVSEYLKETGTLIYITCSIFKQENEEVVEKVISNTGLKLITKQLINGISYKSDSMFVAILCK